MELLIAYLTIGALMGLWQRSKAMVLCWPVMVGFWILLFIMFLCGANFGWGRKK